MELISLKVNKLMRISKGDSLGPIFVFICIICVDIVESILGFAIPRKKQPLTFSLLFEN